MKTYPLAALPLIIALISPWLSAQVPVADSKAIKEHFESITAEEMEQIRGKKILIASRSFGLNLFKGLKHISKEDAKYDILASYKKFDVFKSGGDVSIVPEDAFADSTYVHILATHWPLNKRLEEVDEILSPTGRGLGDDVDIVIVFYHTGNESLFEPYAKMLEKWRGEYPDVRFIAVTSGLMGPKYAKQNEESHQFGESVRAWAGGKFPLYDMAAILSDDFRCGYFYCPEYSQDPADVHPNLAAGESMMAKGFLLALREAISAAPGNPATAASSRPAATPAAASTEEKLDPGSADYKAVRAILDANGLTKKAVEGTAIVEKGRVVGLYLQEGGVTQVPDEIGTLTELRRLHLYGDRSLAHPLLKEISPAIGKCVKLEELLLTQNELTTLPAEIANLKQLKNLSIAENRLDPATLPPAVVQWAQKHDPKGLANQQAR